MQVFSWHSILSIFRKSVENIQFLLKYGKNNGYFTWKPYAYLWQCRGILLRIRTVSDKSCRKNRNTILCSVTVISKNVQFMNTVEKYCLTVQTTDDNMAHAHCMLDNIGYKHKLRLCKTCWFSTATLFPWEFFYVMLYAYCPYCSLWREHGTDRYLRFTSSLPNKKS
jgi:hypothetical protein